MKTHIDFFPANLNDWNKKRFHPAQNLTSIPDRHKEIFQLGLKKLKSMNENKFVIIAFYQEDSPSQVFKYITHEQYKQLTNDINWKDSGTRDLQQGNRA